MEKKYLYDILLIRVLLIFLLIIYHSFAIYNGGWKPLDGNHTVELYKWIADISYSFLLELFVFISGVILGFQVLNKGNVFIKSSMFIKKKVQRLLIPSIVFSTLYILIFNGHLTLSSIYDILNGYAHMWFLPMLFLCFCYIYFINKCEFNSSKLLVFTFFLAIQPMPYLPFQIYKSAYYFFFFYLGYNVGCRSIIIDKYIRLRSVIILLLLYIVSFLIFHVLKYHLNFDGTFINKLFFLYIKKINVLICSLSGLFLIYIIMKLITSRFNFKMSPLLIELSGYCFGVYLVHQFILKILYGTLKYVYFCGPYLLPIISFIITIILSVIIVKIILRTKLGRYLLA